MGNKKGHRQYGHDKHAMFNTQHVFPGYPHRRHRKGGQARSEIKRIKDMAHIEDLEEEISEI